MTATRIPRIWLGVVGYTICFLNSSFAQEKPTAGNISNDRATTIEELEAYRIEFKALHASIPQAWRTPFVSSVTVPAATKVALRNLSQSLTASFERLPQSDPEITRKIKIWSYLSREVFTLQVMLEWQNFETSWREFELAQERITQCNLDIPRELRAEAIADLVTPILRFWISSHTTELTPWIEKFETEWLVDSKGNLPVEWLRLRCDLSLALAKHETTPENQNLGKNWTLAYLINSEIQLKNRTFILTRYTLHMHSMAKTEDAVAILKWWKGQHPDECIEDIRFLHASFFVNQIGKGDREEARKVIDHLDALVSSGSLSPEDERFQVIIQNYYQNLQSSDLEHTTMTSKLMDSHSQQ